MDYDSTLLSGLLDKLGDCIGDAFQDTLIVIPFLFITYLILEFIEHKMSVKSQNLIKKTKFLGPLFGSALGIIPQCGFSSAASTFYAARVISIGTLFAVYLSTSDEMIPIFIAGGMPIEQMLLILLIKFIIGIIIGFAIDLFMRILKKNSSDKKDEDFEIHNLCKRAQCRCSGTCEACKENPESVYSARDDNKHEHNHNHSNLSIIKPTILHTFHATVVIFLISFILDIIVAAIGGNESLGAFIESNKYISIAASALVGLIPNCGASIVVSQLFVDNIIGAGALISGLLSAGGIGYIVLFRSNRPMKQNFLIIICMFIISLIFGLIISFVIG